MDILGLVVDEEYLRGVSVESLCGGMVDSQLRLGESKRVRPGAMVEAAEPFEALEEALGHGVTDIGENAGADAGTLKALGPLDHWLIRLSPKVEVGIQQSGDLVGREGGARTGGDLLPVRDAGQVTTIIGVTVVPIATVKGCLVEAGDLAHPLPSSRVGWSGKNHAVVEEDCLNRIHELMPIVGELGL